MTETTVALVAEHFAERRLRPMVSHSQDSVLLHAAPIDGWVLCNQGYKRHRKGRMRLAESDELLLRQCPRCAKTWLGKVRLGLMQPSSSRAGPDSSPPLRDPARDT